MAGGAARGCGIFMGILTSCRLNEDRPVQEGEGMLEFGQTEKNETEGGMRRTNTGIVLFLILGGILLAGVTLFGQARAEDAVMKAAKDELVDRLGPWMPVIEKEGWCAHVEALWDIVWPLAKEGNPAARAALSMALMPMMDLPQLLMPGNEGDRLSEIRDIAVMLTYSLDYYLDYYTYTHGEDDGFSPMFLSSMYELAGFGQGGDQRSIVFMECVAEERKNCAALALKENIVPRFEVYAAQIDAFLAAGMKPKCLPGLVREIEMP